MNYYIVLLLVIYFQYSECKNNYPIINLLQFRQKNASKTEYLSVGEGGRSSPWRFFSISRTMSWFSVLMCNLCIWTLTSLTSSWLKSYHGIYVLLYTWTLFPAAYTYNEFSLNSHLKYTNLIILTVISNMICHFPHNQWHNSPCDVNKSK